MRAIGRNISTPPQPQAAPREAFPWAKLIWGGLALLGLVLAALIYFVVAQPVRVLPRLEVVAPFTLRDSGGVWLSDGELRGRPTLVSFAHSGCGEPCAPTLAALSELQAGLMAGELQVLTISLDADESAAGLAAFAAAIGADGSGWRVLGGPEESLRRLAGGGFGIYFEGRGADLRIRDRRAALLDEQGIVRAIYDGNRLTAERVWRDLGLLAEERVAEPWARPLYEAAHLFTCYAN